MTRALPSTADTPQDADRLKSLPPLEAVRELLSWWPSIKDATLAFRRYLPEDTVLEARGVYAWRQRGIPRSRQTAVIRAVEDDFGVQITFEMMEQLTQDRISHQTAA